LKYAPWGDPSWELWGHASSRGWYQRSPERYFDLHRRECWTKTSGKGQKYLRWLGKNTVPIFMQERYPEVPASFRYPIEQVTSEHWPYLTCHAAYMIALALMEGATHIGFFGVNYGKSTDIGADCEYGVQRGSCEFWMGVAHGKGVQLVIPKGSTLLQDPPELYGYASHDEDGRLIPSYTKRTWMKPDMVKLAEARPKLANGLVKPTADILRQIEEEEADNTRPAGLLGPLPDDGTDDGRDASVQPVGSDHPDASPAPSVGVVDA
jgi:hypothetical protein